jgi:hypothetical protein
MENPTLQHSPELLPCEGLLGFLPTRPAIQGSGNGTCRGKS